MLWYFLGKGESSSDSTLYGSANFEEFASSFYTFYFLGSLVSYISLLLSAGRNKMQRSLLSVWRHRVSKDKVNS